jgi:adenylylsulfate reductase subunit B
VEVKLAGHSARRAGFSFGSTGFVYLEEVVTMPTFVRTEKCDGCKGQDKTACMYICPHDLMHLDRDGSVTGHAMKAYNVEPEQCWECYSCVKICPQNAIECRHYADIVPLGASVQPLRGTDSIMWTIKFRNGTMKRFKFPIRTTPEGSADPYGGKPKANMADISNDEVLFTKSLHAGDRSQFIKG